MKYNIGDKVMIRKDLQLDKYYEMENSRAEDIANDAMVSMAGQIVTIVSYNSRGFYAIEEDDCRWAWADGMFDSRFHETNNDSPFKKWELSIVS